MTQWDLSDRTAALGRRVLQNTISRLESGAAYRIDNREQLEAMAKALGYESDVRFILAAYGPNGLEPEIEILEVIHDWPEDEKRRAVRVLKTLADPPRGNR
jgi:transcriptional regulator with XRE-family HTH domain